MMKLISGTHRHMAVWGAIALACAPSPRAEVLALVAAAVAIGACLLGERQRRNTLVALIEAARPGTVIVQDPGFEGSAMRIEIGHGTSIQVRSRDA